MFSNEAKLDFELFIGETLMMRNMRTESKRNRSPDAIEGRIFTVEIPWIPLETAGKVILVGQRVLAGSQQMMYRKTV